MVSMKDIAAELNLSRCTVSDILNNKTKTKSYKQETIDLVLNNAKEMGYITNNIAKSLKTGRTKTIALVVPDISNSFYIHIIKEIENLAYAANYSTIICITEENLEKENHILHMLSSRMVDGILISAVSSTQSLQDDYPFQIVCFDRAIENKKYCSITINNELSAYNLGKYFIEKKARNPLFISTSSADYTVQHRIQGFLKSFSDVGIEIPKKNILYDVYNTEMAYKCLHQIIESNETEFDSIALSTNYYIYGILKALKEKTRQVKALGGFETFSGYDFFDNIICIQQPEKEMASLAFLALLQLLKGEKAASKILDTSIFYPGFVK